MQRADVGMVQLGDRAGLALEPRADVGVIRNVRREDLDGDRSIEPRVGGFIDLTHPTRTDRRKNFVRSQLRAGSECHISYPWAPVASILRTS